jgi:hypothetical protein
MPRLEGGVVTPRLKEGKDEVDVLRSEVGEVDVLREVEDDEPAAPRLA